ncbi:MAG: dihydroneopterin aldolase [Turicibacter sp.]|nr:dihydroneopterin aldolase [Turicibacter sp.]
MFYINLNDLEFMAKHGVLESEKVTPQKFVVDVRIETDQVVTAASTDCIDDALNYVGVSEVISEIMMTQQYDLIETIAMKISTVLVEKYDAVISVDTKVTKVNPPIEGFSGTVSCEYTAFGSE